MSRIGFAVVLPARYHSRRFPGKPLAVVSGRPLIEWVYLRAKSIRGAERVVVATDHEDIAAAVKGFGGSVVMTGEHPTGTDRVAEVAASLDHECIVNLQGDEPVFSPSLVEEMVEVLFRSKSVDIVTACHPVVELNELENPNHVKVTMDRSGRALYFSRAPIPYGGLPRGGVAGAAGVCGYRHIGIYAFRKSSLIRFANLPPTPLELAEGLEQLRALEHGMVIHVVTTRETTVGVDVPEDMKKVEKALSSP